MKVKVLIFPLALIIATWIAIGQIWPGVTDIRITKTEIAEKVAVLEKHQTKKDNIALLVKEINAKKDVDDFVSKYLPTESREEDLVNWIDRTAADSGLNKLDMSFETMKEALPVTPDTIGTLIDNTAGQPDVSQVVVLPKVELRPSERVITIEAIGKYENISKFIDAIYHSKRLVSIESFSVEHEDEQVKEGVQEKKVSEFLGMKMSLKFNHAPKLKMKGNYEDSAFDQPKFDFSKIQEIAEEMNMFKPIEAYTAGERVNPFLP